MSSKDVEKNTYEMFVQALNVREALGGACLFVIARGPLDWARLREAAKDAVVIIAACEEEPTDKPHISPIVNIVKPPIDNSVQNSFGAQIPAVYREDDDSGDGESEYLDSVDSGGAGSFLRDAFTYGFHTVRLENDQFSIYEQIQSVIFNVSAAGLVQSSDQVVVLYSSFHPTLFDSISILTLGSHLDRLTPRGLRTIAEHIPYKTFRRAIDLAMDIGREGREGKKVGTLLVIGDSKRVLRLSTPAGFDPVNGYMSKERNINDAKTREGLKEIAQLDGAFVIAQNGEVKAACRLLSTQTANVSLSKGFGTRHWAAAAISKATKAVAIAVSQSSGTIRVFVDGEPKIRIESRHNAEGQQNPTVWHDAK